MRANGGGRPRVSLCMAVWFLVYYVFLLPSCYMACGYLQIILGPRLWLSWRMFWPSTWGRPGPHSRTGRVNQQIDDWRPHGLLNFSPRRSRGQATSPHPADTATLEEDKLAALADRLEGGVFGALVGDALALGAHYEYDSEKIWRAYGGKPIERLEGPGERFGGKVRTPGWKSGEAVNFHPTKHAGDLTDYGDNTIMLIESLAENAGAWRPTGFAQHWKKRHAAYSGYRTMATRHTYSNLLKGAQGVSAASDIDDMGGATRAVGLILSARNESEVVEQAREACQLTHRHPLSVMAAEFLLLTAYRVAWRNESPVDAINHAADILDAEPLNNMIQLAARKAREALDAGTALSQLGKLTDDVALTSMLEDEWAAGSEAWQGGKASPVVGALPGAIYFVIKYGSLSEALPANAMVGGDSSARAIPIGLILGAHEGRRGVPRAWLEALNERERVDGLLKKVRRGYQYYPAQYNPK